MKLRRKLLAAGFALGATALTLTTSTFAWYTSNTDVTMTGATGVSASNGDSLLLISKEATDGTFTNSVNLNFTTSTLVPVEYNAAQTQGNAPTFYSFADGAVVTSVAAATTTYLDFDLYFKSTTAQTVYLKTLTVSNTTLNFADTAKDVLSTTGLPSSWNVASSKTYTMDVMRALKMAFYTETHNNVATTNAATAVKSACYDLSTIANLNSTADTQKTLTSGWNAHTYYQAVTGKAPKKGDTACLDGTNEAGDDITVGTTEITLGSTLAGTSTNIDLHAHFYFFIDGWDLDCFDAVQGQTFTVAMTFTTKENTKVAKA